MNKIKTIPDISPPAPIQGQLYEKDGNIYILARSEGNFSIVNLATGSFYSDPKPVIDFEMPPMFTLFKGKVAIETES